MIRIQVTLQNLKITLTFFIFIFLEMTINFS